MENGTLVKTKGLTKSYPIGGEHFLALKGVDLEINKGDFTGLVGPSGSGKTTLLNILGVLDNPTDGEVEVLGEDVKKIKAVAAARLRSKMLGFIFQTYNLLPVYTVFENVEFPLLILNGWSAAKRKEAVMQALEWVGLTDKVKNRPAQLSGGESQRVAVARAMVKKPQLILADEPTANLDAENSLNILETMQSLNKDLGTTFLFATHDEKVIGFLKRKVTLIDGLIAADEAGAAA
ncbi:MAG: ABC transporter ATP-binding protein [Candidatus Electryonea clarkiae]|nr:ABC transporter ATP-binding protein [Candidatus Electryonea clarkiae]MDP8289080.1 ABC transporter ATP-binding protein [Candidatus Electryonea clarkiae]